jgi:hypothetical protein
MYHDRWGCRNEKSLKGFGEEGRLRLRNHITCPEIEEDEWCTKYTRTDNRMAENTTTLILVLHITDILNMLAPRRPEIPP